MNDLSGVLEGMPNNTCTVGYHTWVLRLKRPEIDWLDNELRNRGLRIHWMSYSATPISKRNMADELHTGLDFPAVAEAFVEKMLGVVKVQRRVMEGRKV